MTEIKLWVRWDAPSEFMALEQSHIESGQTDKSVGIIQTAVRRLGFEFLGNGETIAAKRVYNNRWFLRVWELPGVDGSELDTALEMATFDFIADHLDKQAGGYFRGVL